MKKVAHRAGDAAKRAARAAAATTPKAPAANTRSAARKGGEAEPAEYWELRLYVTGQTPRSIEAFANLKRICEEHLHGRYQLEVIDLLKNPALARGDQILAVPTLVRRLPAPVKKVIGDFSNTERVLVGLDLRPLKSPDRGR